MLFRWQEFHDTIYSESRMKVTKQTRLILEESVRFPFVFLATLIVDEVANLRRCSLLKMRQEIAKWRHGYSGYVNRASLEFTI